MLSTASTKMNIDWCLTCNGHIASIFSPFFFTRSYRFTGGKWPLLLLRLRTYGWARRRGEQFCCSLSRLKCAKYDHTAICEAHWAALINPPMPMNLFDAVRCPTQSSSQLLPWTTGWVCLPNQGHCSPVRICCPTSVLKLTLIRVSDFSRPDDGMYGDYDYCGKHGVSLIWYFHVSWIYSFKNIVSLSR